MARRLKEQRFLVELRNAVLTQLSSRAFWYKIPDPSGQFASAEKRPFDVTAVIDGRAIAIEAKSHHTVGRWSPSVVQPHQIAALEHFERAGGLAWIVVNERRVHRSEKINRTFLISPAKYRTLDRKERYDLSEIASREMLRFRFNGEWAWDASALIDDIPANLILNSDMGQDCTFSSAENFKVSIEPFNLRQRRAKVAR